MWYNCQWVNSTQNHFLNESIRRFVIAYKFSTTSLLTWYYLMIVPCYRQGDLLRVQKICFVLFSVWHLIEHTRCQTSISMCNTFYVNVFDIDKSKTSFKSFALPNVVPTYIYILESVLPSCGPMQKRYSSWSHYIFQRHTNYCGQ